MNRSVSVGVLVCATLAAFVVIVGASGSIAAMEADRAEPTPVVDTQSQTAPTTEPVARTGRPTVGSSDFDTTTFELTVHENGSATWTFRYEMRFDDDDQREEFEMFAERFESDADGTDFYDRFHDQARSMTEAGAEVTDREMEATNFNRSARVEGQLNPVGVVEMSFTWHEFADVDADGDRLVVGDVFEDLYLTEDQTIVIEPDDGLAFERIEPDDGRYVGTSIENAPSVRWSGEQRFIDGHPRAVFVLESDGGGGLVGGSGFLPAIGDDETSTVIAAVVALLALGLAAFALYRRQTHRDRTADAEDRPRPETGDDRSSTDSATTDPLADDELLTDEDQVVELIRENGGRMKQVNIVKETGWSKSKVSMLLSDMEEEGTISKLRVGRENIISLEGFEPEATKSPFEE